MKVKIVDNRLQYRQIETYESNISGVNYSIDLLSYQYIEV
jgi:hypothetical protein